MHNLPIFQPFSFCSSNTRSAEPSKLNLISILYTCRPHSTTQIASPHFNTFGGGGKVKRSTQKKNLALFLVKCCVAFCGSQITEHVMSHCITVYTMSEFLDLCLINVSSDVYYRVSNVMWLVPNVWGTIDYPEFAVMSFYSKVVPTVRQECVRTRYSLASGRISTLAAHTADVG